MEFSTDFQWEKDYKNDIKEIWSSTKSNLKPMIENLIRTTLNNNENLIKTSETPHQNHDENQHDNDNKILTNHIEQKIITMDKENISPEPRKIKLNHSLEHTVEQEILQTKLESNKNIENSTDNNKSNDNNEYNYENEFKKKNKKPFKNLSVSIVNNMINGINSPTSIDSPVSKVKRKNKKDISSLSTDYSIEVSFDELENSKSVQNLNDSKLSNRKIIQLNDNYETSYNIKVRNSHFIDIPFEESFSSSESESESDSNNNPNNSKQNNSKHSNTLNKSINTKERSHSISTNSSSLTNKVITSLNIIDWILNFNSKLYRSILDTLNWNVYYVYYYLKEYRNQGILEIPSQLIKFTFKNVESKFKKIFQFISTNSINGLINRSLLFVKKYCLFISIFSFVYWFYSTHNFHILPRKFYNPFQETMGWIQVERDEDQGKWVPLAQRYVHPDGLPTGVGYIEAERRKMLEYISHIPNQDILNKFGEKSFKKLHKK